MPSGETKVWNSTWTPFSDDDAGFRGIAGIARDATDRHRALEALARTKKKYEAVFNFSAVSLIVINVDTGRVIEANEGFEKLYGISPEAVEGTHSSEEDTFLDPDFIPRLHERVLEEGRVEDALARARHADGRVL